MAHWVKPEQVPLYIQEIIFTKLHAMAAPYWYLLRGTPGGAVSTYESARAALDKLVKWCKSVGAEVKVLHDNFGSSNVPARHCRFRLEITDPVSQAIDELIKQYRKDVLDGPQSRVEWLQYRERMKY